MVIRLTNSQAVETNVQGGGGTTTRRRRTTRSKCCLSRASLELWHLKKKKRDQEDTTLWCWVAVVLCVFFWKVMKGHVSLQ
jgi:hypothetical protein